MKNGIKSSFSLPPWLLMSNLGALTAVGKDIVYSPKRWKNQLMRARTMEAIIAVQKLARAKPGTMYATNKSRTALITIEKSPSVSKLMGSARMSKIGRKVTLISPRTTATVRALSQLWRCTPGTIWAMTTMAMVLRSRCRSK